MSWVDGTFLLLALALSFFGFKKGIIHIAVVISSILAGAAAASAFSGPAGAVISNHLKMPGWLALVIAAILAFALTALTVRAAGLLLKKLAAVVLPGVDRLCGLAFGFFLAAALAALASVFLYIAPEDSGARNLYDESFSPGFFIRTLERLMPGEDIPEADAESACARRNL